MNRLLFLLTFFIAFSSLSAQENESSHSKTSPKKHRLDKNQVTVLNELKDEINNFYGFHEGSPSINSGPCGRFAHLFYQKWNEQFVEKVTISFIMSADSSECYHVLIKLPDNTYYDGGTGIMKKKKRLKPYEKGTYIVDMIEYDYTLLEAMSYGLDREYPLCLNYSDPKTSEIIEKNLQRITNGRISE